MKPWLRGDKSKHWILTEIILVRLMKATSKASSKYHPKVGFSNNNDNHDGGDDDKKEKDWLVYK